MGGSSSTAQADGYLRSHPSVAPDPQAGARREGKGAGVSRDS